MARTRSLIRQRDIARALKAAVDAGVKVDHIEIKPDGTLVIEARNCPAKGNETSKDYMELLP